MIKWVTFSGDSIVRKRNSFNCMKPYSVGNAWKARKSSKSFHFPILLIIWNLCSKNGLNQEVVL